MAEAVFDIAKSLLQQLSSPLKDEFLLLRTSKNELNRLQNTISTIKDLLEDAEQKQATNAAVKRWLGRLQDEMCKADDLFDLISTRALQKKVMTGNKIGKEVCLFLSKNSNHLSLLYSTAHKVKELRGRLDDVANDINKYSLITTCTESLGTIIRRREECSFVEAGDIIGRDKDRERIVSILKANSDHGARVSAAAVVGIGGMGKTALAQLVYNELKKDQGQFDLYLWICVSKFSDLVVVLKKIVSCDTVNNYEGFCLEQLQCMLREKINGKKYLLVLDDVWHVDLECWSRLKGFLWTGGIGSKILVTTRSGKVAKKLSVQHHHILDGLSNEDAWSLFKRFAFDPCQEEINQKMEKVGRDIVKRCANVPLAIKTMGSFLRYKDEKRWLNICDHNFSAGSTGIMEVLQVSYDDLSPSLKHCFSYCSLFPKGHHFATDHLIRLWMAQGFIRSSDEHESLEEAGVHNIGSLLQRCFFQDVMKGPDGRIYGFRMHDLFHVLATRVSGRDRGTAESVTGNTKEPLLHLLVDHEAYSSKEFPSSLPKRKGLRTLIFHHLGSKMEKVFVRQAFGLKSLRALDLRGLEMRELPSSMGNLVLLRYLDLSRNGLLVKLPDSICKLQNLQTLDVSDCSNLKKLPGDLRLLSLRHLLNYGCGGLSCMPSGLQQMTSLVSLGVFAVDSASGGLRYLKDLNHLRGHLTIKLPGNEWKNSVEDTKESMFKDKTELKQVFIKWGEAKDAMRMLNGDEVLDQLRPPQNLQRLELSRFPGTRMPDWISTLENLKHLTIENCAGCQQLPPLCQLRSLTSLLLRDLPIVEHLGNVICVDTQSCFPSLVQLWIWGMPKLKGWWGRTVHAAAADLATPLFPVLSDVRIRGCPELTVMPLFPYVKKLSLCDVNEKLVRQSVLTCSCENTGLSTSHQTWCRLEELEIDGIKDLVSLPEEWGHSLSMLRKLKIVWCPGLKTLPHTILHCLTSVEKLDVSNFKELKLWNEENEEVDEMTLVSLKRFSRLTVGLHQLKGLHHLTALRIIADDADVAQTPWIPPPNLQHLEIKQARKLSHFKGVFHHLNKLVSLRLKACDLDFLNAVSWDALVGLQGLEFVSALGMKGIPESCRDLSNLQRLHITHCHEMESLPDWITYLQELNLSACTLLSKRFKNTSDPLRSQIQPIPCVRIL